MTASKSDSRFEKALSRVLRMSEWEKSVDTSSCVSGSSQNWKGSYHQPEQKSRCGPQHQDTHSSPEGIVGWYAGFVRESEDALLEAELRVRGTHDVIM